MPLHNQKSPEDYVVDLMGDAISYDKLWINSCRMYGNKDNKYMVVPLYGTSYEAAVPYMSSHSHPIHYTGKAKIK